MLSERDKARFWAKVDIRGEDECWPWTGSKQLKTGYGNFWLRGKPRLAHVVALLIKLGKNELLEYSLHTCDNRLCCNIKHLYEGSYQQNTYDKLNRVRNTSGTGKGINHHNASLSKEQVDIIRTRRSNGETCQSIADSLMVSRKTVERVWRGDRYQ